MRIGCNMKLFLSLVLLIFIDNIEGLQQPTRLASGRTLNGLLPAPCSTSARPISMLRCEERLHSFMHAAAAGHSMDAHAEQRNQFQRLASSAARKVWQRILNRIAQWRNRGRNTVRSLLVVAASLLGGLWVNAAPSFASAQSRSPSAIVRIADPLHRRINRKESAIQTRYSNQAARSRLIAANDPQAEVDTGTAVVQQEVEQSWEKLISSLEGAKQDALIMLIATSIVIPLFTSLKVSPIVGFMIAGMVLGPSGLNWVTEIETVDHLGELGIVFFLFEMGLELSLDTLKAMRTDVFGLGTCQFLFTSAIGTLVAKTFGLSIAGAVTIGGSMALSSSAFVLQLLKDKNEMGTRFGKASFGILLLQDLAVVPLLIVVELLSKGGSGLGRALASAGVKALITLTTFIFLGRKLLDPIFSRVARSSSHEAFLSIILTTVLLMSFVTKGIGLSDTLGAFLAGLLLSETSYRYQIESDISPFRGLLLGLFFITVGFSIDIGLLMTETRTIAAMLAATTIGKASIVTLISLFFGIPFSSAQHAGLMTAQVGELAFVAVGIAERSGMLDKRLCKLLLTTVALSMASTPILSALGARFSQMIEQDLGLTHYSDPDVPMGKRRNQPNDESSTAIDTVGVESAETQVSTTPAKADAETVFICGYGRVGQVICEMLDRRLIPYVVLEKDPEKAIAARSKGLPVYYGDVNRAEVLQKFHVESAKACVLTIADMSATNKAVVRIRKLFPQLPIIARAKNLEHKERLERMVDNVHAEAPALRENSVLLTLPFAGTVLKNVGLSQPEMEQIMEDVRKMHLADYEETANMDNEFTNLIDIFRRKGTPSLMELRAEEEKQAMESKTNISAAADAVQDAIMELVEAVNNSSDAAVPITCIERAENEIRSGADVLEKLKMISDITSEDLASDLMLESEGDDDSECSLEETRIEEYEMELDAMERKQEQYDRQLEIAREAYAIAILDGRDDSIQQNSTDVINEMLQQEQIQINVNPINSDVKDEEFEMMHTPADANDDSDAAAEEIDESELQLLRQLEDDPVMDEFDESESEETVVEVIVKVQAKDREVIEGVCDEKGFLPDDDSSEIVYRTEDDIVIPAPTTVKLSTDSEVSEFVEEVSSEAHANNSSAGINDISSQHHDEITKDSASGISSSNNAADGDVDSTQTLVLDAKEAPSLE